MSLVWHIVCKDLRRLRLPLLLWLGLMLAYTALLANNAGTDPSPAVYDGWRYFANTWGVIVAIVGFVLAAWLVMEDSLVTTKAFWVTRPISGGRLLAAKALGALLMFSVAPVLVLTPVWLGCGFAAHEWAQAAWNLAVPQGVWSVAAFVIAGVTATSGQFLVRAGLAAIVGAVGAVYLLGPAEPTTDPLSTGVIVSRIGLAWILVLTVPFALIVHQYFTRRTGRTWALVGLALGLLFVVRLAWQWDVSPLFPVDFRSQGTEEAAGRRVTLLVQTATITPSPANEKRQLCRLEGGMGGLPAGAYVRINASMGEWVAGEQREPFFRRLRPAAGAGRPPEHLVRHLAGLPVEDWPMEHWSLGGEELNARADAARAAHKTLEVATSLTLMRGRSLGELPLRLGAELRSGASRTRIIAIVRSEGNVLVRLEDRAANPKALSAGLQGGMVEPPSRMTEDGFVFLHRSLGVGQVVATHAIGTVQINSILVGQRQLVLTPPTHEVNGRTEEIPGWEDGAMIVQVHFQPESTFIHSLTVNPFVP